MSARLRYTTVYNTSLQVREAIVGEDYAYFFYLNYSLLICAILGRDFNPEVSLTVPMQVEKLILQATSLENLCQCFSGWCAFW